MDQRPQLLRLSGDDPQLRLQYVFPHVFPRGPDGKPDRATIDAALPEIRKILGAFDRAVGGRDFVAGDSLTLADILLAPMIEYVKAMPEGKDLMASFPDVRRVTDNLAQRPSYVAATQPPA
jgi:glutathione S-transferase